MTRSLAPRAVLVLLLVGAAAAVALTIPPRLGLDLRGGTQLVLEARDSPTVRATPDSTDRALDVLRRRVDALGVAEARVTAALARLAPGVEVERDELIGPSLGAELRLKALVALGVALLAQLAYLSLRFRWTYGVSAALAMAHDVVVLVGIFAWLGKPVAGVFLAAVLTVIGYSVNDTVVLFDRVRERRRAVGGTESWPAAVNSSVLSTAPRTVNTGLGALFVLVALAVLGGDSLHDFAIALIIGIVAGTWSSSFTAAPLLIELQGRRPDRDRATGGRAHPDDGTDPHDGADPHDRASRYDRADPYGRPDAAPDASGPRL